jgi:hypothetical protein
VKKLKLLNCNTKWHLISGVRSENVDILSQTSLASWVFFKISTLNQISPKSVFFFGKYHLPLLKYIGMNNL